MKPLRAEPRPPAGLLSGFRFGSDEKARAQEAPKAAKAKPLREQKSPPVKIDPKFFTAARELRDRWMERVNGDAFALSSNVKYHVTRVLEAPAPVKVPLDPPLPKHLPAAA